MNILSPAVVHYLRKCFQNMKGTVQNVTLFLYFRILYENMLDIF